MKTVQASTNLEILEDISQFLRAFWDHQEFRLGRPHVAYRALTGFLLGIRLVERFGEKAVLESGFCSIHFSKDQYEVGCLNKWIFRTHGCYDVVGFHGMEALLDPFYWFYVHLGHDPRLRTVDECTYDLQSWASNSVALAIHVDNFGRLDSLRECCLAHARQCGDWLTLGLANLDCWWTDDGEGGLPDETDVMALALTSGYTNTPIERIAIASLLNNLKQVGSVDEWGGDLGGAVEVAFMGGRSLSEENHQIFEFLLKENSEDFNLTGHTSLGSLLGLYKRFIPSNDPADWEDAIAEAACVYTKGAVRIPYLYDSINLPSMLRCSVDFGFWGGLMVTAQEKGLV